MMRAFPKLRAPTRAVLTIWVGAVVFIASVAPPQVDARPKLSGRQAAEPVLKGGFEPMGSDVGPFGLPKRIRHEATGIVMVLIPSDRVLVGSPESEEDRDRDEAQRDEVINSPFYLGETEVTVEQWLGVMEEMPRHALEDDRSELPITGVSWHDAQKFLKRLNSKVLADFRLPNEVEWEHACRAGSQTPFSFGENVTTNQVNFDGKRPYADASRGVRRDGPVPVRSLPANDWGLYEMHGNVFEWCEDLYEVDPARPSSKKVTSGSSRVIRGGAWSSQGKKTRSAYRDGYAPSSSGAKYGFRVALSMEALLK